MVCHVHLNRGSWVNGFQLIGHLLGSRVGQSCRMIAVPRGNREIHERRGGNLTRGNAVQRGFLHTGTFRHGYAEIFQIGHGNSSLQAHIQHAGILVAVIGGGVVVNGAGHQNGAGGAVYTLKAFQRQNAKKNAARDSENGKLPEMALEKTQNL